MHFLLAMNMLKPFCGTFQDSDLRQDTHEDAGSFRVMTAVPAKTRIWTFSRRFGTEGLSDLIHSKYCIFTTTYKFLSAHHKHLFDTFLLFDVQASQYYFLFPDLSFAKIPLLLFTSSYHNCFAWLSTNEHEHSPLCHRSNPVSTPSFFSIEKSSVSICFSNIATSNRLEIMSTTEANPVPAATEPTAAPVPEPTEAAPATVQTSAAPPEDAATTSEPAPADTTSALVGSPEPKSEPAQFKPSTQFRDFALKLPSILEEVGHNEMWGVTLSTTSPIESHVPIQIVLQKFLNANEGDIVKAEDQFKAALKFRKERKPLELLEKAFNKSKFGDLGLVTVYKVKDSDVPEVFTWNLYGNVKDQMDEVFVPLEESVCHLIPSVPTNVPVPDSWTSESRSKNSDCNPSPSPPPSTPYPKRTTRTK